MSLDQRTWILEEIEGDGLKAVQLAILWLALASSLQPGAMTAACGYTAEVLPRLLPGQPKNGPQPFFITVNCTESYIISEMRIICNHTLTSHFIRHTCSTAH